MARSLLLHTAHPCIQIPCTGVWAVWVPSVMRFIAPKPRGIPPALLAWRPAPSYVATTRGPPPFPASCHSHPHKAQSLARNPGAGSAVLPFGAFLLLHGALNLIHLTHAHPLPLSGLLLRVDVAAVPWRACAVP